MIDKKIAMCIVTFIMGIATHALFGNKDSFLNGRLSACNDLTSAMNQAQPMGIECVKINNDVYMVTPFLPGVKISLKGEQSPRD